MDSLQQVFLTEPLESAAKLNRFETNRDSNIGLARAVDVPGSPIDVAGVAPIEAKQ